jgi:hypothetical protein
MDPRKSFLLRINPALFRELESWAQQELRSVNGQIEYLLKEAVAKRGRGGGAGISEGTSASGESEGRIADPPRIGENSGSQPE